MFVYFVDIHDYYPTLSIELNFSFTCFIFKQIFNKNFLQ